MAQSLTYRAEDGKEGLTLAELAAFLKLAVEADVPFDDRVVVLSTWNGRVKRVGHTPCENGSSNRN